MAFYMDDKPKSERRKTKRLNIDILIVFFILFIFTGCLSSPTKVISYEDADLTSGLISEGIFGEINTKSENIKVEKDGKELIVDGEARYLIKHLANKYYLLQEKKATSDLYYYYVATFYNNGFEIYSIENLDEIPSNFTDLSLSTALDVYSTSLIGDKDVLLKLFKYIVINEPEKLILKRKYTNYNKKIKLRISNDTSTNMHAVLYYLDLFNKKWETIGWYSIEAIDSRELTINTSLDYFYIYIEKGSKEYPLASKKIRKYIFQKAFTRFDGEEISDDGKIVNFNKMIVNEKKEIIIRLP